MAKIRSILNKLIYNDIYSTVNSNMSCSNIGARKGRNIRDHLFVLNGILNDVSNNSEAPKNIDIQIYDVAKCFDKLEHTSTSIDLFTVGVNDDKFITITNSNMQCEVAVKTPWGSQTARTTLQNI